MFKFIKNLFKRPIQEESVKSVEQSVPVVEQKPKRKARKSKSQKRD